MRSERECAQFRSMLRSKVQTLRAEMRSRARVFGAEMCSELSVLKPSACWGARLMGRWADSSLVFETYQAISSLELADFAERMSELSVEGLTKQGKGSLR
jgi:hypothetical protein